MPREEKSLFELLAAGRGGFEEMPQELPDGAFSLTEAEHRVLKRFWSIPVERGVLLSLKQEMREVLRNRLETCAGEDVMLTRGQIALLDEFFAIIQVTAEKELEPNAVVATDQAGEATWRLAQPS